VSVLKQKTINENITFNGIGLHSGLLANMTIKPAEPNSGIIFKRIDLNKNNIIIPNIFNVRSAVFCTTISNESGASVSTIEHLMGALYGMGVDNALIEIDNQEVPILDGSAKLFVEAISKIGIKNSDAPIKIVKIEKRIEFKDGNKTISIEPSKISLDIDFELKYENDLIGTQRNLVKVFESDLTDVYNSRTFCLFEDVEKLKEMGLAKGGNLDNAIVVKNNKILNENGLRNEKEFVNHKILDCMGDLYLVGYKIIGKITCSQGGHKLTNQLLRKFLNVRN
jgi:UDP-3-O-[3-hydroxymyristoyl] N-acetylglucosamine deacetylase